MDNKKLEWLKSVLKDLENDALNGQNVACAVVSIQACIISELEKKIAENEREAA